MDTATIVLITLVVYKLFLIGVGFWAQRKVSSSDDFFLGGRALGPVVGALSYSASSSSAWTLLGLSGSAYVFGISTIWIALGSFLGMLIAWYWIAPRLMAYSREHNLITLTDFLAHQIDGGWRKAIVIGASIIVLVSLAFYVAAQFQGAGNTFAATFNMDRNYAIILGGVIVMIYTFLGGFWAVSVTDAVQGSLMAVASVLLPIAALMAVGGVDGFIAGLQQVSSPEQLSFTGKNAGLVAIGFLLGSLAIGLGTLGQPHLLVRFMALKDAKALSQARIITILWFTIVFGGMVFLGLVGRVLFPDVPNPEQIFFVLTTELFPPVVGAILLAAVLSAIMSTADSQLLVAASSVTHDMGLGKRFFNQTLLISRLTIAVLTGAAILVAVYLPATIFNRALFAWVALGAGFGPIIIMRLAGVKAGGGILFSAMTVGFMLAVIFYLQPNTPGDIVERLLPFASGLLIIWFGRTKTAV
jgi:sodium/proline symporter